MKNFNIESQEYFGWIGNTIFLCAQLSQILYTHKIKETHDISFTLQILFCIGNIMYTTFGFLDNSVSMFIGNGLSLLLSLVQISQKMYYDKYCKCFQYQPPEKDPEKTSLIT